MFPASEEANLSPNGTNSERERMDDYFQSQHHVVRNSNDDLKYGQSIHQTPEYSPTVSNSEAHTNRYPLGKNVIAQKVYSHQAPDTQKMTVDPPPERISPREIYSNPSIQRNYRKGPSYPFPKREPFKQEDGDEYPLPDFIEPPMPHNNTKIKVDPNWTDSDQDIGSDNETHLYHPTVES